VRVKLGGEMLADSTRALRVLETSHPPTIYVPLVDVRSHLLTGSNARSTWDRRSRRSLQGTSGYARLVITAG